MITTARGELSHALLRIPTVYESLTKSEQKVADTVQRDPEAAVFCTITDLAEKSEVGETSVIRFCRKLGFRGYQEFKLSLAQNVSKPEEQLYGDIQEDDGLDAVIRKICGFNTQVIQNVMPLLSLHDVQAAVKAVVSSNRLLFFGVGSSGITAMDAKYRFVRLGYNVVAESDSHVIAMNASLAGKGDVVFGISVSGSTKDVVAAIKLAKANGAFIVCLTSHARSPITQYADVVLLTTAKESPLQGGSFASKLAQITVLDILSTAVALAEKQRTYRAMEKTAKSVLDKLY
ncbi:MAG: MurR/RpiR family transcriptional regulator [Paenibacillaceae bacterium]|nr:MurR/RpiR family transcriptional regulator [Paenibacillaceae bacterium]